MHIETLKTFCDLVETSSFNKAAQLSFISQSAVSQQLRALETRYGRQLLERGAGRGVVPTGDGQRFYEDCKAILDRFRGLEERVRGTSATIAGAVRIATVYSVGLHTLPPFVTTFMKAHPQVKVHIEYSRTDKVCEGCRTGLVDIGIVALPVRRTALAVTAWREEALVVVCSPDHRFGQRRRLSVAKLSGEPFIAFERDIPTRKTIDAMLKAHRVRVRAVMEFDNIETIKRSIEVGSGISILPEPTVVNEVRAGLLRTIPLAEGPLTRTIGIIHRRGRVLPAASAEFVRVLTSTP